MQKIVLYLWVLVWVLQGGESVPGLVVAGSTDVHMSEHISNMLRQRLPADPKRRAWLRRHRIGITIQPFGPYHVVLVGPTPTEEIRDQLMVILTSYGMRPFRANIAVEDLVPLVKSATGSVPSNAVIKSGVDWIWMGVFLLALMGLITSIVQRKGVLQLTKGQEDVRNEQKRMDRELDGLQGEQRG